jgi:hypothetical protein
MPLSVWILLPSTTSLSFRVSNIAQDTRQIYHAKALEHLSLSRLNHWLPRCETHPEVVQGTAEFHHEITDALLPQPDPIFYN